MVLLLAPSYGSRCICHIRKEQTHSNRLLSFKSLIVHSSAPDVVACWSSFSYTKVYIKVNACSLCFKFAGHRFSTCAEALKAALYAYSYVQ
jgi:hypothetical protein